MNKGKEVCVVINSSSSISIMKGEVNVDNVKLLCNTDTLLQPFCDCTSHAGINPTACSSTELVTKRCMAVMLYNVAW